MHTFPRDISAMWMQTASFWTLSSDHGTHFLHDECCHWTRLHRRSIVAHEIFCFKPARQPSLPFPLFLKNHPSISWSAPRSQHRLERGYIEDWHMPIIQVSLLYQCYPKEEQEAIQFGINVAQRVDIYPFYGVAEVVRKRLNTTLDCPKDSNFYFCHFTSASCPVMWFGGLN